MGYHKYKSDWTPYVGQHLICCLEPTNPMDKYAVSALEGKVVGHLMHGSSGRFAKVIFYFLQANPSNTCTAVITGKPVNLGKGKGMQVPCTLKFDGSRQMLHTTKLFTVVNSWKIHTISHFQIFLCYHFSIRK